MCCVFWRRKKHWIENFNYNTIVCHRNSWKWCQNLTAALCQRHIFIKECSSIPRKNLLKQHKHKTVSKIHAVIFVIYPNFIFSTKKFSETIWLFLFSMMLEWGLMRTEKNRSFDFCPFIQLLTVSMKTEIIWVFIFWKVIQRYDLMTLQQKNFNGKSEKNTKWSHQQMSRILYGTLCFVFADIKPFLSLQKSEK